MTSPDASGPVAAGMHRAIGAKLSMALGMTVGSGLYDLISVGRIEWTRVVFMFVFAIAVLALVRL